MYKAHTTHTCVIQSEKPVGGIERIKMDDTQEEELFHFQSPFKFIFGDKLLFYIN